MADRRSIVVYGAGAVGCYLGGKLTEATGDQVTLVGREPMVAAIQLHGLILRQDGVDTVVHPNATTSADGVSAADLVLLTVRAYDVAASILDMQALRGEHGLVVGMQNGVGSEELLAEALGRDHVLAGTLTASVVAEEPGVVVRRGHTDGVALAGMGGTPPVWVVEQFAKAGLPTITVGDYRSLRWSKLLLNMLGATASAILDVDIATVAGNNSLFRLEQLAFREAGSVMDAQRIPIVSLPGYPVPLARLVMRAPRAVAQRAIGPRLARSRGGSGSPTMRSDVARGRSEVAFLNGAVAAAARELGIAAPVNAAFTELTEDLLRHPKRRADFRGSPEKLLAHMTERGIAV